MSARIKKYANLLQQLHRAPAAKKKALLKKYGGQREFVKCLCECSKNILCGNIALTPSQKRALLKRKSDLKKLSLKKTSLKTKKRIVQKGGFLGALLGPIVSILGGLFNGNQS